MTLDDEIALVVRQERTLVLPAFDEGVAFAIGSTIRERARQEARAIVVDLRTWDRQMFFAATAGTSADNAEWVRRKANAVRRFLRSSYRLVLEKGEAPLNPQFGADTADIVVAGGSFPLSVRGAGIVGAVTVSGLPGRSDHGVVVDALCDHLGVPRGEFALPLKDTA